MHPNVVLIVPTVSEYKEKIDNTYMNFITLSNLKELFRKLEN